MRLVSTVDTLVPLLTDHIQNPHKIQSLKVGGLSLETGGARVAIFILLSVLLSVHEYC